MPGPRHRDVPVDDEMASPRARAMLLAAWQHEVESYGIADGMCRRAVDPAYAHEPVYLAGHRTGLALPAHPDPGAV